MKLLKSLKLDDQKWLVKWYEYHNMTIYRIKDNHEGLLTLERVVACHGFFAWV